MLHVSSSLIAGAVSASAVVAASAAVDGASWCAEARADGGEGSDGALVQVARDALDGGWEGGARRTGAGEPRDGCGDAGLVSDGLAVRAKQDRGAMRTASGFGGMCCMVTIVTGGPSDGSADCWLNGADALSQLGPQHLLQLLHKLLRIQLVLLRWLLDLCQLFGDDSFGVASPADHARLKRCELIRKCSCVQEVEGSEPALNTFFCFDEARGRSQFQGVHAVLYIFYLVENLLQTIVVSF